MALKGLGYRNDHPVIKKALDATRELIWDQGDSILFQPCVSPNWDTALAAKALIDSGLAPEHPALRDASKWLIDHQIFKRGDWSIKRPDLEPGGWAFEFYNDWYPDVDDSAVILMVLADAASDDAAARERAISARRELGDGHAVEGRRLRRFRCRQQSDLVQPRDLRGRH